MKEIQPHLIYIAGFIFILFVWVLYVAGRYYTTRHHVSRERLDRFKELMELEGKDLHDINRIRNDKSTNL